MAAVNAALPPELQIVGATIRTSYGTTGTVVEVTGPHPPDPNWYARPWMGGWSIRYVDESGAEGRINEVYVESGMILAHPWRDRIVVEERGRGQLQLFG